MSTHTSWVARFFACSTFAFGSLALAHCGGAVSGQSTNIHVDGGGPGPDDDAGAPGTSVGPCGSDGSCPSGSTCYFPIGDCSSGGECVTNPAPGTPECGAVEILCGCNGSEEAYSGCGYPTGYGSAPSSGTDCSVLPAEPPDAGPVGPRQGFDASQGDDGGQTFPEFDAGEPTDGQQAIPAGTDVGPCTESGCPEGSSCFFRIGPCPGSDTPGRCIEVDTVGGTCGAIESICGCNGEPATTGCGFPSGYASAASTGSPGTACPVIEDAGGH